MNATHCVRYSGFFVPTVKQLVGNRGSHHPRYHASKPPTPKLLKFPTSLNCASARERALEGAREDRAEATRMSRATLTTQATERFVRARPERRMPTARTSVSVRAFSFLSFSSSRKCPVVYRNHRAESDFAARDLAVRMDDLEFDFEDDINATDVGQPQQAPETLPDRARKNYRQVRARHTTSRV